MSIYTMNPGLIDREAAMTWAIVELLPEWLSVIMPGAITAAIISTADSALHSTVSTLSVKLIEMIYQG